jgi:hypothetical protein
VGDIYFFQSSLFTYEEDAGPIKIGYTDNKEQREKQLRKTHGPIVLLGSLPGSFAEEKNIHRLFSGLLVKEARIQREWFWPGPSLVSYIREEVNPSWRGPKRLLGENKEPFLFAEATEDWLSVLCPGCQKRHGLLLGYFECRGVGRIVVFDGPLPKGLPL